MAIDPKLVSIKTAAELPSGIPTAEGEFLYFEDETLKKAEMSDLYDRLESAYLGIITPSSTIPATGSWYGTVLAAGTFNNVSPAITVDAADFDEENGTANNEVRIIITDGVATKDVRRVKGEEGAPGPSTIVINDLTTGGATDALSAEQGKIINDQVFGETETAGALQPLANYTGGIISGTSTYINLNGAANDGEVKEISFKMATAASAIRIKFLRKNSGNNFTQIKEIVFPSPVVGINTFVSGTDFTAFSVLKDDVIAAYFSSAEGRIPSSVGGNNVAYYAGNTSQGVAYDFTPADFDIALNFKHTSASIANRVTNLETEVSTYDELIEAISKRDIIRIAPVTINVTANIIVPSNKTIIGSGSKTLLQAAVGVTRVLDLNNSKDVTLKDFTVKGVGANVDNTSTALINLPVDAVTNTNIGTGIGIYLRDSDGAIVENIAVKNFDNSGIQFSVLGIAGSFSRGIKLNKIFIEHCYNGIYSLDTGEYSQIDNVTVLRSVIGIQIRSGNLAVSNSQFTNNRIGAFVGSGGNNAHGTFTGCFFNHNKLRSVYVNGVTNGHAFANCHAFDGTMEIVDSRGINWNGGIISAGIIHTSLANTKNSISNVMFIAAFGGGTITQSGVSLLNLKNNVFIDGSNAASINN